jgi:peptidoglycan hydrolase-like protein with peptidoglycan-binding domain
MKKGLLIISVSVIAAVLTFGPLATAQAQTALEEVEVQIKALLVQIEDLRNQLKELEKKKSELRKSLKETLALTRNLWSGLSHEEVKLLQEILRTDPEIYPEGLITGYFGPLTQNAVKKFQKKFGIVSSGEPESTGYGLVGPRTRAKINELLTEGAGESGKVPPGLLIAPGIAKKLGFTPTAPEGQTLPPGIAKKISTTSPPVSDTVAPILSGIEATSTTATTTRITWNTDEPSSSTVKYATSTLETADVIGETGTSTLVTLHDVFLANLFQSTTYYYIVSSEDQVGNKATSTEFTFTTLSE